ncbi:MAG: MMPL family transporter [Gammaproteobacteria bacterium]|nr:MMPL family transporter [Gammaproteobacteria bacterium]MDH3372040.1 MMPL family transporter [Gammaproteobacteria bacterium]MDH3407837.1 MMPL family transporter [Gammaproteobacteria bacterium]
MKPSLSTAWQRSILWLAAASLMILVLAARLEVSFDLSAFLPQQTTLTHDILIEQIRKGPGSRLLVIGVSGAPQDRLAEASEQLRQTLSANPAFVSVLNGELPDDSATVPEPINRYYLLMRDIDYSLASLQRAVQARLQDLAFGAGSALLDLIARDPFLVTLEILESLAPVDMGGDLWFAADGSAVLLAETRAASIDIAAQSEAVRAVRNAFAAVPAAKALSLDVTGVGAFSVELQEIIRAEATKRTVLATSALLLVLLVVFRSPRLLLLATVPLGMGFLAGLALVSLVFDQVHGITLAFGFTLLGVAVDYPLHLFSHAQHDSGQVAMQRIWPTLRLGVLSTVIAYLALAFSGSQGLAQLGLFTAGGVTVAMLATRAWLPLLLPKRQASRTLAPEVKHAPMLRYPAAVIVLLVAVVAVLGTVEGGLWDDELSSLSPVAVERLAADRSLRAAAVTPDMRYQLVMHNTSLETLLQASESADRLLAEAVDEGLLENWQSVSQMLPSLQSQQRRQDAIPAAEVLQRELSEALIGTPFRADAFDTFAAGANTARTLPALTPSGIVDTPLRSWLDSHLLQLGGEWVSLISVVLPRPDELAERVSGWNIGADLVDLQASSVELMRDYRNGALRTILVASLIIIALLWFVRGQFRQTLWIGLTVAASLAATIATITMLHGNLTVIHLVALLLVLGLGLDYALFLSRSESLRERRATDKGVLACAASTTLAFGILAGSSIPLLKFLGLTVASGALISYLVAYSGSRLLRKTVS